MAGGRPSTYTEETANLICERLAGGESLRTICADEVMPAASSVFLWLTKHEKFSEQYAQARASQMDAMAEDILEIADESSGDAIEDESGNVRTNHEVVARSKLRVDTRKWLMSKLAPKKYGDRIVTEHTGKDGGPIETADVSLIEVGRRLAFTLKRAQEAAKAEET